MEPSMITLIVNLLLLVFVVWGLLWGLGRGLVKSSIRLAYFIGFVIIFALVSPLISQALMGIQLPEIGSVADYIENAILADPTIAEVYAENPALQDLIAKLPAVIINLVVFMLLVVLAKFFSWIAYRITCRIHFKKPKEQKEKKVGDKVYTFIDGKPVIIENRELKESKPNKHRLLGGLVGAFQGLAILFCLFLPITGVISIAGQYIDTRSVEAESVYAVDEDNTKFKYEEISNLLKENLPPEFVSYLIAYQNSITNKVLTIGDIDLKCFDVITTTTVDGEKVTIRKEIDAVANVAESVLYVQKISESETGKWADLDFKKITDSVNALFESGIVNSVGMDALDQFLSYLIEVPEGENAVDPLEETGMADEIRQVLGAIQENLNEGKMNETLKNDVLAVVGIAQQICESGLMDELMPKPDPNADPEIPVEEKEITADVFIEHLSKTASNSKTYLNNIFTSLFTSSTLKTIMVETANIGLQTLQNEIAMNVAEYDKTYKEATTEVDKNKRLAVIAKKYEFDKLTVVDTKWNNVADNINDICEELIDLYNFYKDNNVLFENFDLEEDLDDLKTLLNITNLKDAFNNVGNILNNLTKDFAFFKTKTNNVMNQALTYMNDIIEVNNEIPCRVGDYFDLTKLQNFDWKTNFTNILYDLSQIAKDPVSSESIEDYNWSGLNYFGKTVESKHIKGITEVFNDILSTQFFDGMQTKLLTLLDDEIDAQTKPIWDSLKSVLISKDETVSYSLKDKKGEILAIINSLCVFGESGAVDLGMKVINETMVKSDITNLLTNLKATKQGETESQINRVISYLFDSDVFKQLLITEINTTVLPMIGTNLGQLDKDYKWTGWNDFEADFKSLFNKLIIISENLDIENAEFNFVGIEDILNFVVNDDFDTASTGTAVLLGQILDILHNSQLFNYGTNQNVINNILADIASSYIYTEKALATDRASDFWEQEFAKLGPTISILNATEFDEESTLLIGLIGGADISSALGNVSDTDMPIISDALIQCSIIKDYSVTMLNMVNQKLISLIDSEAEIEDACNLDTNFEEQSATLKQLLLSAKKCMNYTDIETALKNSTGKQNIKELLTALKNNADFETGEEGIFYTAYYDYYKPYDELVNVLDSNYVEGSSTTTLLDAVLLGNDISSDFLKLSEEDIQKIVLSICDCKLLKTQAVDMFNKLNKEIIKLVNSEYNTNVCDVNTNLLEQKEDILSVISTVKFFLEIENIETNFNVDTLIDNKNLVKRLLTVLNSSANHYIESTDEYGIFVDASEEYTKIIATIITEIHTQISNLPKTYTGDDLVINVLHGELVAEFVNVINIIEQVSALASTTFNADALSDATEREKYGILFDSLQDIYNANPNAIFAKTYENLATPIQNTSYSNNIFKVIRDYITAHCVDSSAPDYVGDDITDYDWITIFSNVGTGS